MVRQNLTDQNRQLIHDSIKNDDKNDAHIFASALHVYDLIGVIIITPKLKRNVTNVTFHSTQLLYLLSVRNLCLKEGILLIK